jgi:hypothetical protein
MALDVVPPGDRDIGTGKYDTRDVPVQELDTLVYQRFESHGLRCTGRGSHDGIGIVSDTPYLEELRLTI